MVIFMINNIRITTMLMLLRIQTLLIHLTTIDTMIIIILIVIIGAAPCLGCPLRPVSPFAALHRLTV